MVLSQWSRLLKRLLMLLMLKVAIFMARELAALRRQRGHARALLPCDRPKLRRGRGRSGRFTPDQRNDVGRRPHREDGVVGRPSNAVRQIGREEAERVAGVIWRDRLDRDLAKRR